MSDLHAHSDEIRSCDSSREDVIGLRQSRKLSVLQSSEVYLRA